MPRAVAAGRLSRCRPLVARRARAATAKRTSCRRSATRTSTTCRRPTGCGVFSLGHREALAGLIWLRALVYFGDELQHRGEVAAPLRLHRRDARARPVASSGSTTGSRRARSTAPATSTADDVRRAHRLSRARRAAVPGRRRARLDARRDLPVRAAAAAAARASAKSPGAAGSSTCRSPRGSAPARPGSC